ncbi:PucR family transcriptional regulator ligand-binding domain-containing protein [Streptomyces sp. MRC013]|uniref:PucR family transcriptional regulator n=1 Tax=Streptomyces sp. MRC013 TaxID=2898276 RepID=UPI002026BCE7|nr:PucR family transcriptional regulator ligand-binding domain-containing protein [Streptomyces sp. MRC013]URM90869.1 PucR family transcriptional regulator ligand-binding domain-containing protein [Streptomyces sp. MRC013]
MSERRITPAGPEGPAEAPAGGSGRVLVEDLLALPALQLKVLAGASGLRRSLSWAHPSELVDPTPWLLGAEMIMTTGYALPWAAAAQRAYLERLDDAGVSALAVSARLHAPPLRPEFLATADERGFPVLEVPLSVPFVVIAQEVAAAVMEGAQQRLGPQLQVFGALRWLAAEDLDTPALFRRLERLSGYDLYLSTPRGGPLLPGMPPVPDPAVLPRPGTLAPGSPAADVPPTIPGGFLLPVPAPDGPAGFLVAYEREGARPAGLAVAQHIATVAALRLAMVRSERETSRREGAETLAELLQNDLPPDAARRRLLRHGIDVTGTCALFRIRHATDGELLARLADHPHLLLHRGGDHYVLGAPALADHVAALPGVTTGRSRPFEAGAALRVAQREAAWALTEAVESGRALVVYGDSDLERWLPGDPAVLAALVEHVLGSVIAYDAAHDTHLLASARTWLERDRRTEAAAEALHIHPNTLAYRLRRFSAISGRDLTSSGGLAEVWLAIHAARATGLA